MDDSNRVAAEYPCLIDVGMRVEKHVMYALDAADRKQLDSALLHACIAIDATARKLYPQVTGKGKVGKRYVDCLREYVWLLEPLIGAGIDLAATRFPQVGTPEIPQPDFADIVYKISAATARMA